MSSLRRQTGSWTATARRRHRSACPRVRGSAGSRFRRSWLTPYSGLFVDRDSRGCRGNALGDLGLTSHRRADARGVVGVGQPSRFPIAGDHGGGQAHRSTSHGFSPREPRGPSVRLSGERARWMSGPLDRRASTTGWVHGRICARTARCYIVGARRAHRVARASFAGVHGMLPSGVVRRARHGCGACSIIFASVSERPLLTALNPQMVRGRPETAAL